MKLCSRIAAALYSCYSSEQHIHISADGFIPGLATVTKDALDLSSSDIFLLAVCYEAKRSSKGGGGGGRGKSKGNNSNAKKGGGGAKKLNKDADNGLQKAKRKTVKALAGPGSDQGMIKEVPQLLPSIGGGLSAGSAMINTDSWKGGEMAFQRQRLAATFAFYDTDRSGFLEKDEIAQALTAAGFLISKVSWIDRHTFALASLASFTNQFLITS